MGVIVHPALRPQRLACRSQSLMHDPERYVYYVAFHKHGEPQHLVSGPFVDEDQGRSSRDWFNEFVSGSYSMVRSTITIEEID
jgi:hypothetical protein